MNFLNLYYFTIVAEELNITKASKRLFISQQSLSKHIINLEDSLEIKLFSRSPNLSLTYAGIRLLRMAKMILDMKRQIIMEMDDINNHLRGELRIGVSHTRGRVLLPKILPSYYNDHKFIDVSVVEGNSKDLEDWLRQGQIDLLIGFAPIMLSEAEVISLLDERLLLVVPNNIMMSLFPKDYKERIEKYSRDVDISAFSNCPYLMMSTGNRTRVIFDRYINHLGIPINIILEMENIETLLSLACEGMGLTVYPEMFLNNLNPLLINKSDSPVHFFPLNEPSTIGNLVIAYHQQRYLSEADKDFIESCKMVW